MREMLVGGQARCRPSLLRAPNSGHYPPGTGLSPVPVGHVTLLSIPGQTGPVKNFYSQASEQMHRSRMANPRESFVGSPKTPGPGRLTSLNTQPKRGLIARDCVYTRVTIFFFF